MLNRNSDHSEQCCDVSVQDSINESLIVACILLYQTKFKVTLVLCHMHNLHTQGNKKSIYVSYLVMPILKKITPAEHQDMNELDDMLNFANQTSWW